MPALRKGSPSVEDKVRAELQLIRAHVAGVRGSLAATSDGLVVAHDVPDVEPSQIAAIAAATLALASRATLATGCGTLREAVARGTDGYLAVYAAGDSAIVAVMGTSGLNVGMLQYRVREIIDRIAEFSTQAGAWAAPAGAEPVRSGARAAGPAADGSARQEGRTSGRTALPRRRPAAS
jgi:predicted regulator of Ras-like GTPase activity (Roadblock/LC7/MglB family)